MIKTMFMVSEFDKYFLGISRIRDLSQKSDDRLGTEPYFLNSARYVHIENNVLKILFGFDNFFRRNKRIRRSGAKKFRTFMFGAL